jgi:Protein of unknown function (DUF2934)
MAVKKSSPDKTPSKKKTLAKNAAKSVPADQNGGSQTQTGQSVTIPEYEIRRRAYELYQARGCQHGFDWDDWIRAEAEIMSRHKESA